MNQEVPKIGFDKHELEKRLTEATMLKHIVATAGAPLEPVTVLNVICAELIEVVGVEHAGFARLNEDGESLTIVSEFGESKSGSLGAQISLEDSEITQMVISRRLPMAVLDAQQDPRMGSGREVAKAFGVESMLIVPIIAGRRVVGTLGLDSYSRRDFNEYEIEVVQAASSAAAPLLENAELFDQLRAELRHRQQTEAELRRSRMIYQELVNSLEGVVWEGEFRDGEVHFTFISRQVERLFGYPTERFLGSKDHHIWAQVLQTEDWNTLNLRLRNAIKTLEPVELEARAYDDQGELMWIQDRITLSRLEDSVRIRGLMVNITEHKRSVRLERERNQILELIARNVELDEVMNRICELVVYPFQRAACVIRVVKDNQLEFLTSYGLPTSLKSLFKRQRNLSQLEMHNQIAEDEREPGLEPKDWVLLQKHDFHTIKSMPIVVSGVVVGLLSVLLPSGGKRNLRFLHSATELCAIAIDRNTLLSQLEYRATHDHLTDLANRGLYHDRLTEAMQAADQNQHLVGLLYIDLDNFKFVNDNFSHATGDELLRNIARQLQKETNPSNTVARLGGDEFAVILPKLEHEQEVLEVAAALSNTLTTKIVIGTHQHEVSASIGTAIYPLHGKTADELSKAADHAMYARKKKAKNR